MLKSRFTVYFVHRTANDVYGFFPLRNNINIIRREKIYLVRNKLFDA